MVGAGISDDGEDGEGASVAVGLGCRCSTKGAVGMMDGGERIDRNGEWLGVS